MKHCLFWLGLLVAVGSVPAQTVTLSNPETIIKDEVLRGPASPYPSSIEVTGMTTAVQKVTVTLHGLSHTFPDDLDILLVGPGGQTVMLMSDAGSEFNVSDLILTFDDQAPTTPPNSAELVSGTFRPVNHPAFNETNAPPAPTPPYGSTLSVFNGTDPNGVWSLYVMDDTSEDGGIISDGWSLTITAVDTIADLALTMTAVPGVFAVGTNITYKITATNAGPADATGVTVTNRLPAGMQFVSATATIGSCSNDDGVVRCSLGDLPRGFGGAITLVVVPNSDSVVTNIAAVRGNQLDHKPTNNAAASIITVLGVADLAVSMTAPSSALQGSLAAYTITVTNQSDSAASGISLTSPVPDGVVFVSAQSESGSCTNLGGSVNCALDSLNGHAKASVTILCRWPQVGAFTNRASVTANQFDYDTADNNASAVTIVEPATDLLLAMTASAEPAGLGQALTYTIVVSNLGPALASNIVLSDTLPTAATFLGAVGGACTNDGGLVSCFLPSLPAGERRVVTLTARTTALGLITNTASVASGSAELSPTNNAATVVTRVVPAADLSIAIRQFPSPVWHPEPFSYTATLSNAGPSDATEVVLLNTLPVLASLVSFEISQGACVVEAGTIRCALGTMSSGSSATLTVGMAASQIGILTNRASAAASQLDPNPANNTLETVSFAVVPAVSLANSDGVELPDTGAALNYPSTIFVSGMTSGVQQVRVFLNSLTHSHMDELDILLVGPNGTAVMLMSDAGGDAPLAGAVLRFDDAADGLIPHSSFSGGEHFRPTDYSEGAADDFPFPAPAGPYLTSLSAFSGIDGNGEWSLYVLDDDIDGSGALAGWSLEIAEMGTTADVEITGVDLAPVIQSGENIFSITLSNRGPFTARNLLVTNLLAPELRVQAANASQGACEIAGAMVVCNLGGLPAGSNAVITVLIAPESEARTTNVVTAFGGFTDLNPSNNTVEFVTRVEQRLIIVSQPSNLTLTNLTDTAHFEVVATGAGPLQFQWLLNDSEIPGATDSSLTIPNPGPEHVGVYRVLVRNQLTNVLSEPAVLTLAGRPRISAFSDRVIDEDTSISIPFLVRDAETPSDSLVITVTSSNATLLPGASMLVEGSGDQRILRLVPPPDQFGTTVVGVQVSDPGGLSTSNSFRLTVNSINDPPVIPQIPAQSIPEDGQRVLQLILSDVDSPPASLILSAASSNPALAADSDITVTGSGTSQTVTITPKPEQSGTTQITLVLRDDQGAIVTNRFLLSVLAVNDAPTLQSIDTLTIDEDSGPHIVQLAGISSGAPNENQRLRVLATSSRPDIIPHPAVDYSSPNPTGSLTITPRPHANGTAAIVVTVHDSQSTNATATRTFSVIVRPLNDPPAIATIPDQTTTEDTSISVPFSIGDPDAGNSLTGIVVTATSSDTGLIPNQNIVVASITSNGLVRALHITPATNQFGSAAITVTAADSSGASVSNVFQLAVTPVNDQPTLDALADIEIEENAGPQTVILTGITFGPANEIGDAFAVTATSSDPRLLPHPVVAYESPNSTGTVTLASAPGMSGDAVVRVTVIDGASAYIERAFTVRVRQVNAAPTITAIADLSTPEDTPVIVPFTVSDPDHSTALLTVTAESSEPSLIVNSNISFIGAGAERAAVVAPNVNSHGTCTITLTVSDGTATATSSFTLIVDAVNDPPTLNPATNVTVVAGTGLFFVGFSGVSSGATNELQPLSVTAISSNTTLLTVHSLNYSSPDPTGSVRLRTIGQGAGEVTVSLTVNDGGASNNAITRTFNVLIAPAANTAPTISDIADRTIDEDAALDPIQFIVGDAQTPASDLVVAAVSSNPNLVPPQNISLQGTGNERTLTIAPVGNAAGTATIRVSVRDTAFSEVTETFLLTVNPVDDPPALDDIVDVTIAEDGPALEMPLVLSDIDTSPGLLTVTASLGPSTPALAVLEVAGSGTNRVLRIVPNPDRSGSATVSVAVNDGTTLVTQDFQLTITEVEDPPALTLNDVVTLEDTPVTLPLPITDPDTGLRQLIVTARSLDQTLVPDGGLRVLGPGTNRTLSITPATNQFGSTLITVTVDDDLLSATESFILTVLPVNDPPALGAISNLTIPANGPPRQILLAGINPGALNEPDTLVLIASSGNTAVLPHPLTDLSLLQVSNTASLLLAPVAGVRGVAPVFVAFSDGWAVAARSFNVTVDGPPTIAPIPDQVTNVETSAPPVSLTIGDVESGAVVLSLSVSASNPSLFANTNFIFGGGGANRTLSLPPASQAGASFVTVTVTDPRGNSSSSAFLFTVEPPPGAPVIERQPENATVLAGDGFSLQVLASGDPPPNYQWQRDGNALPGATNALLAVTSAQLADAGQYQVVVSNIKGSVTSAAASVRILTVPRIVSVTVEAGASRLSVATVAAQNYTVECQDALLGAEWRPLMTFTATGDLSVIEDPEPLAATRFYRLRTE